jgi:hypothetical protein
MRIDHFYKIALVILGLFFFVSHLYAADIKRIDSNTIRLVGEIKVGDSIKLEKLLKDIQSEDDAPVPYGRSIEFNSKGGVFIEGIRIGYLLRKYVVEAHVKSGSICLSSCALAFLGGSFQYATSEPTAGRFLELGGIIGFHGFYINPEAEKLLQKSGLSAYLGIELSKAMSGMLAGYTADMGISSKWVSKILAKGEDELHFVDTIGDVLDLGIEIIDLPRISAFESYHAINVCNAATGKSGWDYYNGSVTAKKLSSFAAKKVILEHISSGTLLHEGFVLNEIEDSLTSNDVSRIHKMYKELEYLSSIGVPIVELDNRVIYHVDGFNNVVRGLQGCIVSDTMDVLLLSHMALFSPFVGRFSEAEKKMIVYDRSQALSELKTIRNRIK